MNIESGFKVGLLLDQDASKQQQPLPIHSVVPGRAMSHSFPGHRSVQALAIALATIYVTFLLYQTVTTAGPLPDPSNNVIGTIISPDESMEMPVPERFQISQIDSDRSKPVTALPFSTELDDLFISVKTTKHYHRSRLPAIIETWFQFAKEQTWFFTDKNDPYLQNLTNGHMVNTKCTSSHDRRALCCKMSAEFEKFLESGKKWFCHFDDDNYVNVPRLLRLLDEYNPWQDWYLGRPSVPTPLEIYRTPTGMATGRSGRNKIRFRFATGGAGFCISKALAHKMAPVAGGGKFMTIGDKIRLPDDVTVGYIIEHLLKRQLTVVKQFHSHLEILKFLKKETFEDQVSFSYSKSPAGEWNVLKIDGLNVREDPRRFKTLHCHLFPQASICPHR